MRTTVDIFGRLEQLGMVRQNAAQIESARERIESDNRKRDALTAITALMATVAAITTPVTTTVYSETKEAKRSKRQKQRRSRQYRLARIPKNERKPAKLLAFGQNPDNSANVRWSDGSTVYSFPTGTRWDDATPAPISLVSPELWERIPTSDTVFTYDENDGAILPIVIRPDSDGILARFHVVPPQQSRAIRSATAFATFDRIGFLTNELRKLRDSTNNDRTSFDAAIAELSDLDFLNSLRGTRRPIGYKRFSVR